MHRGRRAALQLLAHAVATELELALIVKDHGGHRLRWNTALEVGGVGSFDWTPGDDTIVWEARLTELVGYGTEPAGERRPRPVRTGPSSSAAQKG